MGRRGWSILIAMGVGAIIGAVIGYLVGHSVVGSAWGAMAGAGIVAVGFGLSVLVPAEIWVALVEFGEVAECCSSFGVLTLTSIVAFVGLLLLAQFRAGRIGRGGHDDCVAYGSVCWGALVQGCLTHLQLHFRDTGYTYIQNEQVNNEEKEGVFMREAEHELSQDESAVEISPLPAEKELPAAEKLPAGKAHKSAVPVGRAHWRDSRRYILTAVVLCLALAFLLTNVVLPRHHPPKQSSSPASPTATPATSYVPTDYSVNTTIVNGVAYVGAANGEVYALRTSNGSVLWRHKIDPGAGAAPLVDSGIVYITASMSDVGPGSLYALRASDGVQLWRYTSSDPLSSLLAANGIAYVTSYDDVSQNGSLVALRTNDGSQLWHDTSKGSSYTSLVVDNKVVYVSANDDNGQGRVSATVYALRESSGTQLWHYTTNAFSYAPMVDKGIAYIFSDQGLSALQASNGRTLWSDSFEGNIGPQPQMINGVLYFITTKISLEGSPIPTSHTSILPQVGMMGELLQSVLHIAPVQQTLPLKEGLSSVYAVRTSDGAILWHYTLSKENGNNWANWLSIENGTVYVGTFVDQDKSYIYALRSNDGSVLWRQAMHRGMSANAVVSNGVVYIASFINDSSLNQGSGAVYALRASDGSQLWYHSVYWVVYNPPLLLGATIYVSTTGGDVYTFRASSGSMLWHFHTDVQ